MLKLIATASVAVAALGLAACGDGGSAEKSGENLDSAIEEATQGQENLGDGPLERAGEEIDEATGNAQNQDGADALNDATDGNPNTNP
ncbi:MAG: hypothetical protein AB7O98_02050 [Hyphomonadaceae bacterium]